MLHTVPEKICCIQYHCYRETNLLLVFTIKIECLLSYYYKINISVKEILVNIVTSIYTFFIIIYRLTNKHSYRMFLG